MARLQERWNTHEMSRLNTFLLDALADPNNAELYEKALRLTNTRETVDVSGARFCRPISRSFSSTRRSRWSS